ncbi:uncharacterized protein MYCFIDRAFT_172263 [Pseudocercospora fijiensis CIRAD86]|uniref:Uncharacterized protein n=1 Tax=Pseudocercospora fijiensis (strain CIRAD86) TaxID=383855 RepID=M3API4_PSEFD|nr:uncharacterized protein MYCFIDRAFT_172263 [Pseudocercospora fijiensis CIRAD86]EME86526.1 hypothetical protein MYCFIDRAFT_172263 [Pseudocercospora fijiensis CIRAD86]
MFTNLVQHPKHSVATQDACWYIRRQLKTSSLPNLRLCFQTRCTWVPLLTSPQGGSKVSSTCHLDCYAIPSPGMALTRFVLQRVSEIWLMVWLSFAAQTKVVPASEVVSWASLHANSRLSGFHFVFRYAIHP